MNPSFKVYIDESGDEGFIFRKSFNDQGSSYWFILAAVVTRIEHDLGTVKIIDEIRHEFALHPRKHVHWKKLKHQQRIRYTQLMLGRKSRIIFICAHKQSLLEPEKFSERYRLYFYAVRYLLERLSWLSKDYFNLSHNIGDGSMQLVFSNRQGMSYEELRAYLRLLHIQQDAGKDIRIDYNIIKEEGLSSLPPGKSMGLQMADAAAGVMFNALEPDRFGNTEPRYLKTITPLIYRHNGNIHGYGIKIIPKEARAFMGNHPESKWLEDIK